ncbi:MAG: acyl-CoA dehydrogenase family protein [Halioglobus sp.]
MFNFAPLEMPSEIAALRKQVRAFLDEELSSMSGVARARSWSGFDAQFSRALGEQGWIGMMWPSEFGGRECSAIERYVVIEELLAAGAPVAAHWIADRQSGAQLLRYGNQTLIERYLPAIARGELFFCIGMSEPNAGSDLAAIRTTATRVEGGWKISGSKLWTTHVQKSHMMIALVRTSPVDKNNRHGGMSQFVIDLATPGIEVRGILDHQGESHFGEVFLNDVVVAEEMLLGVEGEGWQQVNAELALERSGPERYMSSYQLIEELIAAVGEEPSELVINMLGEITAQLWTLRQMSMSVAGQLSRGGNPTLEATIVKDLGACFEQKLPAMVQAVLGDDIDSPREGSLQQVLSYLLRASPAFSLRGGTREILRGIIAKGLGLR